MPRDFWSLPLCGSEQLPSHFLVSLSPSVRWWSWAGWCQRAFFGSKTIKLVSISGVAGLQHYLLLLSKLGLSWLWTTQEGSTSLSLGQQGQALRSGEGIPPRSWKDSERVLGHLLLAGPHSQFSLRLVLTVWPSNEPNPFRPTLWGPSQGSSQWQL